VGDLHKTSFVRDFIERRRCFVDLESLSQLPIKPPFRRSLLIRELGRKLAKGDRYSQAGSAF